MNDPPSVGSNTDPSCARSTDVQPSHNAREIKDSAGRFALWFQKWFKPPRSRASVPPGDIDDLAQEVFVRLRCYSDDTVVDNPQGHLFRVAATVANEWLERGHVPKPRDESWLQELQIETGSEPQNALALATAHVQAAVKRLPVRQREVLLLHVNEGLTYKQIATRLNLTHPIVLRDLTRAYSTLRMRLRLEDL